jgi:Zn ribbon nucleic-acid-binding protein
MNNGLPATKTLQRKLGSFSHNSEMYSPSLSLEPPKAISQTEEMPTSAKICGNCQVFNLVRSRSIATLICLAEFSKSSTMDYWSPRMVEAVESVAKLHTWRTYCKKENAYVTMFERACSFFALSPKEE